MFNTQKKILSIIMEKWINGSYVIIDTETTGLKVDDEIIEIAIINMRGDVLLNTLVKPVNTIPPEATKINNITNEMVASAPVWRDVFPLVKDIISNYKWLAWNSRFDARMMVQTCEKAGVFAGMTPLSIPATSTQKRLMTSGTVNLTASEITSNGRVWPPLQNATMCQLKAHTERWPTA